MKRFSTLFIVISAIVWGSNATPAPAQLVVGMDQTAGHLWVIDLNPGGTGTRQLVSGSTANIYGAAADNANNTLYWSDGGTALYKATMAPTGTLTPVLVGSFNIGGTNVTAMVGLAYDSVAATLYGYRNSSTTGPEGFYSIDVNSAACTLVHQVPATGVEFGGFDYNPADDSFYACTDSAGAPFASTDVYRFPKPIDSNTAVFVTSYPGSDTDIDGLAVGNNKLYLINDNNSPPTPSGHYVYDLATNAFEADVPFTWSATGAFSGGTWAPGLVNPATGADVSITKTDSPDPVVVPVGGNPGNITYTITVTNNGPDPATGVSVVDGLPGNVTFVSVDPPGVHNAGIITANIGNMADNDVVTFNVVVTPNGLGTVTNTASVSSTSSDPIAANNSSSASTTVREPLADIGASITPPANCTVPVGGTASYTFALNNVGPEPAENGQLVVTFPANVTFVSSTPPVVPVGNTLTVSFGTVAAAGNGTLLADFTVDSGTSVLMNTTVSTTTADPNAGNNSSSNTLNIPVSAPTSATITGVFSTIVSSPTSNVPDQPWQFATTAGVERPYRSPDGTKWIMLSDTNNPTATADQVILVGTVGGAFSVVAQEGVFALPEGDIMAIPNDHMSINDAGQFVIQADTSAASNDEVVFKWDGTQFVTLAREGNLCPAFPPEDNIRYGTTAHSVTMHNDGSTSFFFNLINTPGGTATDSVYFKNDGATILAQEGVTIPTNQGNGTTFPYDIFTASTIAVGLSGNAAGTSFCGIIDIITAGTLEDRCLIVDNDVKIQEGFVVPGSGFPTVVNTGDPIMNKMESNGDWFSYGSDDDGNDWVVRNGAVVASTGGEVTPGSGLTWGDASFAQTFFSAAGNNDGDYVVGGVFNGPALSNAALVLNGTTVVARENDPVDLDDNGLFDDGVYIHSFGNNKLFMNNNVIYHVVSLRDANSALCEGTPTAIGDALVVIPIGGSSPLPCCKGDMDGSANVDDDDIGEFIAQLVLDVGGDPCPLSAADVNNDTVVDGLDISPFVDRVLANGGAGTVCPP